MRRGMTRMTITSRHPHMRMHAYASCDLPGAPLQFARWQAIKLIWFDRHSHLKRHGELTFRPAFSVMARDVQSRPALRPLIAARKPRSLCGIFDETWRHPHERGLRLRLEPIGAYRAGRAPVWIALRTRSRPEPLPARSCCCIYRSDLGRGIAGLSAFLTTADRVNRPGKLGE
jgi:hypothetical protein